MQQVQGVTLTNIGGGALAELFEEELARVLANIADPNTDAEQKREITLKVVVKPKHDRQALDVDLKCSSKLASIVTVSTMLFMGRAGGRLVAVESDPRQSGLFDEQKPQLSAVANMADRKAGE